MTEYTIYNDGDYKIAAAADNDGALHFRTASLPDRNWAWADVRDDGQVIVRYNAVGTVLTDPEGFLQELEQAIQDSDEMVEAVDRAQALHRQERPLSLTVEIMQTGAAFEDNPSETQRLLAGVADALSHGRLTGSLLDSNGNTVGTYRQTTASGLDRDLA